MKNLHNQLFLSSLLSIFLFVQTACHSTLEPELVSYNTELRGDWQVTSFQVNGEEQIDYSMSQFNIIFAPEEASSGMSKWDWKDSAGMHIAEENFYTLSADGSTILLAGEEYHLDMAEGSFELSCGQGSGACVIIAEHR